MAAGNVIYRFDSSRRAAGHGTGFVMSVDELVEEGEAFRVNFPAASARGVRAHLNNLIDRDRDDPHAQARSAALAGPEGCLGAVILLPLFAAVEAFRRWHHRRQVERAMRVLFPKGRR